MRRNGGIGLRRDVPVVRQHEFEAVVAAVFRVGDQEAGAAAVANRQLQIRAVKHRHVAELEARIPDLRHFFFTVLNHFRTDHAPAVGTRQTGGKAAVFQNGIAVITAQFHLVSITATLTADHLIITVPHVGVFGVQIGPGFRTFQDDLVVVIVHITQRIDGTHRRRLSVLLTLMQLHLVGNQTAVPLLHINITGEHRVVRIVPFC